MKLRHKLSRGESKTFNDRRIIRTSILDARGLRIDNHLYERFDGQFWIPMKSLPRL